MIQSWRNYITATKISSNNNTVYYLTACGPPEEGFAECCFEGEPLFYMITFIDHEMNKEMVSHSYVI